MRRLLALALIASGCARASNEPQGLAEPLAQAPSPLAASASASPPPPPAPEAPASCDEAAEVTLFASPKAPWAGAPLTVVAALEGEGADELLLFDERGEVAASSATRRGGPPFWLAIERKTVPAGNYKAVVRSKGRSLSCKPVAVGASGPEPEPRSWAGEWVVKGSWSAGTEALFGAWIERLFDAPPEQRLSWPALHEVLRDPSRNFLHDHLGEREDEPPEAPSLEPDCADLPYTLRAYFAWKLALPFGFSTCSRGGGGQPPRCSGYRSHLSFGQKPRRSSRAATFGDFVRVTLANGVHSGAGRASAQDDGADFYPVPLTRASLRPGTIFADPYGHVLMVSGTLPQEGDRGGILLAVDGQPDGTVGRKRFWRGNFLFALDPELGSPGFKRFRPLAGEGPAQRPMTNDEVRAQRGDYSLEQYERGVEGFYDAMDDVLSPQPRSPEAALLDTLAALEEQVKTRVGSVENGRKFLETGERAEMPKGAAIFETTGPWEDFSTPSRDLRLLIAIDVVTGFPAQVERRPGRFAIPSGTTPAQARASLEARLADELAKRRFEYTRTDGSSWPLTLAEVVARKEAFEMTYNPNDCVEHRWGAAAGSDEAGTCRRRASWLQQVNMQRMRRWFRDRKRPPRE